VTEHDGRLLCAGCLRASLERAAGTTRSPRRALAVIAAGAQFAGGLAVALLLSGVIRHLLFEVAPTDLASWLGATVVLALVALVACVLPARRAARTDPMIALRAE
jgi:ABC-type antimicrobial peptide transport system permease subunit